jgi:hypothetical protein
MSRIPSTGAATARRAAVLALLLGPLVGCSAHSQAYRGAFSGKIVDGEGHPIRGATVVVCTSTANGSFSGCPHRAEAWTDLEGRFQFWPVKGSSGVASIPQTHLTACARDPGGQFLVASSVVVDASGATEPEIRVKPSHDHAAQSACTVAE